MLWYNVCCGNIYQEVIFLGKNTKSLVLSRILTAVTAGIFFILTFFVPAVARWYEDFSAGEGLIHGGMVIPVCSGLYFCEVMAFFALWNLNRLLDNIGKNIVFESQNTKCLKHISFACMLAGAGFLFVGLWRYIFFCPALFAFMLGLIMRVLENVFQKAVEIKSENDFTI